MPPIMPADVRGQLVDRRGDGRAGQIEAEQHADDRVPALQPGLPTSRKTTISQQHHRRNRECHGGSPPSTRGRYGLSVHRRPAHAHRIIATRRSYPTHAAQRIITIRATASVGAQVAARGRIGSASCGRVPRTRPAYGSGSPQCTVRQPHDHLSFPRQHARTQRFTLGAPRAFTVAPDGSRVVFLRSRSGTDRANLLWVLDLAGRARSASRRRPGRAARRRRRRSCPPRSGRGASAAGRARPGIVGYAVDAAVELAAFALSGRLFTAELRAGTARELPRRRARWSTRAPPRTAATSPTSAGGALRVDRRARRRRATGRSPSPERTRRRPTGSRSSSRPRRWAAPAASGGPRDSDRLLVARVDDAPVQRWWIADPAHPDREPARGRLPGGGHRQRRGRAASARPGRLPHGGRLGPGALPVPGAGALVGRRRRRCCWSRPRDQRSQLYLPWTRADGATRTLAEEDRIWLDLFPGVPAWTPDGRLVRITDEQSLLGRARRTVRAHGCSWQAHGGSPLPACMCGPFWTSATADSPLLRLRGRDLRPRRARRCGGSSGAATGGEPVRLATEEGPHMASAVRGGGTLVLSSATPERTGSRAAGLRRADHTGHTVHRARPAGERPVVWSRPE